MPSQQEVKWSQLKVGMVVLTSTVLLCILLFVMTSATGISLFHHEMIVDAYFSNSSGLNKGGVVELQGVTIGDVKNVEISSDPARRLAPVHVIMKINEKYLHSLKKDSLASLTKEGLVGDTMVEINSQMAKGPQLEEHDTLPTVESTDMDAVMAQAKTTVQTLDATLGKLNTTLDSINSGEGTVGQLVKNRQLYDNLNTTINGLNRLVTSVNAGHGTTGKLLYDEDLYNHLNAAAVRLDNIATNLEQGKGSAGKLLNDPTLYNNMNSALAHMNSILAEADAGKGGLGLMTKNQAFADKLNDSVSNLDTMLKNVNKGQGTLGKLATDTQAYDNLNALLKNSNDLVTMFRQDPKKYLTIHMRVF